jgi:hypothetical protein
MENILKEITGVFDGEKMIVSDGCSIIVPRNYASKSMLLVGTELIYRVTDKGSYFKQTNVPESMTAIGTVIKDCGELKIEIKHDGLMYKMLFLKSSETFYRLKEGDEVVVRYPEKLSLYDNNWCVIEAKI